MIFSRIDSRELSKKIDKAVFPGLQGGPFMHQIAAAAVSLDEAMRPEFKKYAKQIVKNAQVLASELSRLGWRIVSGGTDSHLLLVDTWQNGAGLSGNDASLALEKENIIVNKNTIPFDNRSPFDPSGIRLGTAAETTRGKKEKDMVVIARKIDKILRACTGSKERN
jgi:glycine hydroxymethyltransferase